MDDEKLQRTIDFIIENQAQFTVDIQKLQESHKESEKRISTIERVSLNLFNMVTELTKNVNELTVDVKDLRAAQKETDERLNVVI